jgi:hypothetical protein
MKLGEFKRQQPARLRRSERKGPWRSWLYRSLWSALLRLQPMQPVNCEVLNAGCFTRESKETKLWQRLTPCRFDFSLAAVCPASLRTPIARADIDRIRSCNAQPQPAPNQAAIAAEVVACTSRGAELTRDAAGRSDPSPTARSQRERETPTASLSHRLARR